MRINKIHFLFAYILIFLSENAFATSMQDISNAAMRTTDKSREALIAIFGDVVTNPLANGSGGNNSILSEIFKVSNSCLLVIGGFLALYIMFKKLVTTAHDGNLFEKQQHTLWSPIRILVGLLSLVPTVNGWSLSQLLMLWGASVMGVGIANLGTDAAITALNDGKSMVVKPIMPSTQELAQDIFEMNLCLHAINTGVATAEKQGGLVSQKSFIQQKSTPKGFILKNTSYVCGGASVSSDLEQENLTQWLTPDISVGDIRRAHLEALFQMQRSLNDSAKKFVQAVLERKKNNTPIPIAASYIQSSAHEYENKIISVIGNKQGNISELASKISDSIKKSGWMSLGTWYQTFAQANTKLTDSIAAKATAFGNSSTGDAAINSIYREVMEIYRSQQSSSENASTLGSSSNGDYSKGVTGNEAGQIIGSIFKNPGQRIINGLVDLNFNASDRGQLNPLIKMKNLGDYVMVMAENAISTYTAVRVFEHVTGGFSLAGLTNAVSSVSDILAGVFAALSPFISAAIISLFFFGMLLSIYIPMVPFIIWFGAIINWLVNLAEAIIAAPLWAITHLSNDGEGMGHRTTHGYIFLLNVMIRPILMVIGFFLGGAIVVAGGTLLNQLFGIAIANAQFDSMTGIVSIIAYLAIYVFIALNLIHSSFNLIYIVPDQVINWIGGHASVSLGKDENDRTRQNFSMFSSRMEHLPHGHFPNRRVNMNGDGFK